MSYATTSLGYAITTPAGPIDVPIEPIANAAYDVVWPRMQEDLREELKRERVNTAAMVAGAVGLVMAAVLYGRSR